MPTFTVFKGTDSGRVVKSQTTKEIKGDQVYVRVTASGLCGTDLHYRSNDMALGHEGVGVVEQLGPDVKYLKKGDRVGWGYEHDSCGHCAQCLSGQETYCPERAMYAMADLDQGSFASGAVWREAFLFKIPDNLSDAVAAPLMCGGATVFNALNRYDLKPTETVGIVGMGGLGHLALQFASKMGCNTVVLSGSDSKKDEATKLGAKEFIAMKGAKELKISRPIDRLLVTTSAQPDWNLIIPIMRAGATIHPLGVSDGDFSAPYMPLLLNGLTIQGSVVASRYIHNRMLEFAALHNIQPVIEKFPMTEDGINKAMDRLDKGDIHFRGVFLPESA